MQDLRRSRTPSGRSTFQSDGATIALQEPVVSGDGGPKGNSCSETCVRFGLVLESTCFDSMIVNEFMTKIADWPSTCNTLLRQIRQPLNTQAWHDFVDLYAPLVYAFCRRCGLQNADAEDVSQQVFLQVSRAMERFEYDPGKGRFRSWLGTVVANAVRRHFRKRPPAPLLDGLAGTDAQSQEAFDSEWRDAFNSHVFRTACDRVRGEFDATTWRAFEAVWLEHSSPRQVAETLKKPPHWVYQAKYLVLKRLKQEVQFLAEDVGILNPTLS